MADQPTVVIVDDSAEVRRLVRSRLQLSGMFDVVADGEDGAQAIGLAFQHQPAVLLLDASMPNMDGLEALPAILTVAPETRVVIFTGFEERGLAGLAKELGAAGFVEKSDPIDRLPERLAQTIGSSSSYTRRVLRAIGGRHGSRHVDRDQQILQEHLERFREVFEVAATGMATLTLNGSVIRANRALAALLHCDPEDLVGLDYGQVSCGKGTVLDTCLKSIQSGEDVASFEHELAGYDQPRVVRATLAPIRDSDGVALYALLQVQDVTAQRAAEDRFRRSEERFRLLIAAVEEYAIFMLDTEGHVASWNAGAQRIKGYRAEEIIGRHFRVFYPVEQQHSRHPEDELRLALRDGSYAEDGWRIRNDGSRFWASVVITAVFDDDGNHIGFAKVTRDQTERRMAEEQRDREIEQQNRLLAITAHELRTPTAVIDGSIDTVLGQWEQLPPDERGQLLAGVRTSTRQLDQLATDLLTAARLDAETLSLNLASTTLGTILTGATERFRIAYHATPGIDITVSGDLDAPLTVDPLRIGQAVDNLISNAVRHGRPPIQVTGSRTTSGPGTDPEIDQVIIEVCDAGPGVDPTMRDRLFDRFASGGRTGGTGLGLYIVDKLVRLHGGSARYDAPDGSLPGRFTLVLPVHPRETSTAPVAPEPQAG
ncbi:MAG: PAS domain S-box protein [Microlunatus sp.]|nr:PAS domain S-box protein [Microlunatus sp.]